MKHIGLALGGGGVRAMAHVPVLEAIDRNGLKISALAGTSMGAILGALYASGQTGQDIRKKIRRHAGLDGRKRKTLADKSSQLFKWLKMVKFGSGRGGLLRAEGFLDFLLDELRDTTFEDLKIPLQVVTTDFWTGEEVVFESGPLLPALEASMAIPGIFAPIPIADRVLIDGGMVNNVPYDRLTGRCDYTIAIDVTPRRHPGKRQMPTIVESILGMYDILIDTAMSRKLANSSPNIYFRPGLDNIMTLDFSKIESVWAQTLPTMKELEKKLCRELGNLPGE
jgi:NTE family protein